MTGCGYPPFHCKSPAQRPSIGTGRKTMDITIYDNEGATVDRYTVLFHQPPGPPYWHVGLSKNCNSPIGVCLLDNTPRPLPEPARLGKEVAIEDVPAEVQGRIRSMYKELNDE